MEKLRAEVGSGAPAAEIGQGGAQSTEAAEDAK